MSDSDRFETIYRTSDPVTGEMLEDGPSIDRPEGAAEDEYQPPRRLETVGWEKRAPEELRPPKTPKKRALAAGLPVVMPGLGQVYAGRPWSGVVLMAGIVTAFASGILVEDFTVFGVGYLVALLTDVVAGQLAAVAFNRGRKTGLGLQVIYGFAEAALVGSLSVLIIRLVE